MTYGRAVLINNSKSEIENRSVVQLNLFAWILGSTA